MPLQNLKKIGVCILSAAIGCVCGFGSLISVVESFDYENGALLSGQNGGSGFAGAWSGGNYEIASPGLIYEGVASSGLAAYSSIQSGGSAFRSLESTYGTEGSTWYVSVLMQRLTTDDPARFFGLALYRDNTELCLLGQSSGGSTWRISGANIASTISVENEALLVLRIDSQAGNDKITFWVNPDLSLSEDANTPVGISEIFDLGTVNRIRIGGGNASGSQAASANVIDEIFMGADTPFASVPESATAACLLGVLALLIVAKRRD